MQTRSPFGIALIGSGSALPDGILDNLALEQLVETSDEWIATRTGIRQRRLAQPQESLTPLAAKAAQRALAMADLQAADLDLILLATSTPDDLFGSAGAIQGAIGASHAVAMDLTAACSGFAFGLVTAAQFLRSGVYRNVLLIGADVLSRWVNWNDRGTCILFGDGAGAVVLQAIDLQEQPAASDALLGFELRSDGSMNHVLNLAGETIEQPLKNGTVVGQGNFQPITMNGQEVYRFAVKRVPEAIEKALHRAERSIEQVDWLLLHQANQRIIDAVADRLGLPHEKTISNLERYGNTSAASIPIALDEAVRDGRIQPGQTLALAGFGAGLSWGAVIVRWGR
ncbi:MAG: beta-ketoacyl-ACP synthase III [Limnothrix sp.]|uniref:beta-ketoacyl-ACP synthase III n=1 Tax=unclassified Limnothrix TaxID=2632864 RepID=UPI00081DF80C|nr:MULTISPECIES: beta-ketoacyl-ACP synthase III [unclassified Limnothrix]MEB3118300.1 beta-ketoacyl-ACP synthase III [Limnothrix sp.]OCQ96137.1 3-oxoacyl-ACP synthase [Limnothrix sp. P13C2]MBD2554246.1 ketoacyl-ACP synthase III [Limnothrix sp. FACHB-708]MBD2591386.1 ketoacyl-ACP synthase III [Limnothrix sp. FACHB-406]PIB05751.1 3-oxoacyl-ACP synthase [Limnothrix sp. PR1529]